MATNKTGLKPGSTGGRGSNRELAEALLTIMGIGIAGGIALIGGALKLGEKMLDLQVKAYERIEAEREARREAVREITGNEIGFPSEPKNEDLQPADEE